MCSFVTIAISNTSSHYWKCSTYLSILLFSLMTTNDIIVVKHSSCIIVKLPANFYRVILWNWNWKRMPEWYSSKKTDGLLQCFQHWFLYTYFVPMPKKPLKRQTKCKAKAQKRARIADWISSSTKFSSRLRTQHCSCKMLSETTTQLLIYLT